MLSIAPIISEPACKLADEALALFCQTYGLSWPDSYLAAAYQRQHGKEHTAHILRLISQCGCTFDAARLAVEATEAALLAA
jgi:hypothetical protein